MEPSEVPLGFGPLAARGVPRGVAVGPDALAAGEDGHDHAAGDGGLRAERVRSRAGS